MIAERGRRYSKRGSRLRITERAWFFWTVQSERSDLRLDEGSREGGGFLSDQGADWGVDKEISCAAGEGVNSSKVVYGQVVVQEEAV